MPLISEIAEKHPPIAYKLSKAASQLSNAKAVDELHQIGVLLRDSWIELSQKLFKAGYIPEGQDQPSTTDAKRMLEYTLDAWGKIPGNLKGLVKSLYSLSNQIQHDSNVDVFTVIWGLTITTNTILFILDIDENHENLAERRYYKCPMCGSLKIECEKDTEYDPIDGPLYDYELWKCTACNWEHFLML